MRWSKLPFHLAILAFLLAAGGAEPATPRAARTKVFAHYYPWWNPRDTSKCALKPERGWYTNQWGSQAVSTVKEQIQLARAAGISGFAFEWIGSQGQDPRILFDTFVAANNSLPANGRIEYCLTFDSVIWAMERKLIKNWYEEIPIEGAAAADLAYDLSYVVTVVADRDKNFARQYLHIDGRPAVFVYSAHSLGGEWERAVADARKKAGDRLYLIGDFEFCSALYEKNREKYKVKAAKYDAVTNFTSLNGYPGYCTSSIEEFIGKGELDKVFDNGEELAKSSIAKKYFPGITTQYFKVTPGAAEPREREKELANPKFITDGSVGYLPLAKAGEGESAKKVADRSRETIQTMLEKAFGRCHDYMFINSWNEPEEGTMIEPTVTANPAGYVMRSDFLRELSKASRRSYRRKK